MTSVVYRWHPNAILLPLGDGVFRIFQPDARRNVFVARGIVELADALTGRGMTGEELEARHRAARAELHAADATEFTLNDNAYANSAMCADLSEAKRSLQALPFDDFLELMLESAILCDTWPPKDDFSKRGFADRFRGSFNEQLATEALLTRRTPDEWWTEQKFLPDGELRQTPYRYIEKPFLESYFNRELNGLEALEIGCGTGYWTGRIAKHAKHAVGMDFNKSYLAEAESRWPRAEHPNLEFRFGDILDLNKGDGFFRERHFDRIFLIDVLLFLFDANFQPELHRSRHDILANVRQLLRPRGRILVMDPHLFWLTPWAGSRKRPLAFLTEYRRRRFKETATIQEYSELFYRAGLHILRIFEPDIDPEYERTAPGDYAFMREFPQWWAWELAIAGAF